MKRNVFLLGLLCSFAPLALVGAEEGSGKDSPEAVEYRLSMVALGERSDAYWEGEDEEIEVHAQRPEAALPSDLELQAGVTKQAVRLRLNVASPRYLFKGPSFSLMKKGDERKVYTSSTMPEKGGDYSLFLTQNSEQKSWAAPSLLLVSDQEDVFPVDSIRVVNLSTVPVEIHLGDEHVKTLEPQTWHVVEGALGKEEAQTLVLWYEVENRRRPAFRRKLSGMAGKKMNITCAPSHREGRPVSAQFFENVPVAGGKR